MMPKTEPKKDKRFVRNEIVYEEYSQSLLHIQFEPVDQFLSKLKSLLEKLKKEGADLFHLEAEYDHLYLNYTIKSKDQTFTICKFCGKKFNGHWYKYPDSELKKIVCKDCLSKKEKEFYNKLKEKC